MQKVRGFIAQYPRLTSLSTGSFLHRSCPGTMTSGGHKSKRRGSPTNFCRISLGRPDGCKFLCVFSRYYLSIHTVSLSRVNISTFDMMHNRSCLADMQHTGEKGLKPTSHMFGQVLNVTTVQILAKALFGCEVFVDGGFHILVPIVSQL